MKMPEGILYLIPCTLGEYPPTQVLPVPVLELIRTLDTFIVENSKSARAFLKACEIPTPQNQLQIFEIDKHDDSQDVSDFISLLVQGKNAGLISEAGVPAVADPGAKIVKLAHQKKIKVVPLTGPSSLLLALMASGMDGQRFTFHGYLPFDKAERIKMLQRLEKDALQYSQTQLFIETPYRNNNLLKDICDTLQPHTRLCVAVNLTLPDEKVITLSIRDWKKQSVDLHKKPTVFLIGA
jgi:16S rRNA (cytidine1402-2'-O)-methyltransferase